MTNVWVTGMGLCSALGETLTQSWTALVDGKSGILLQQPFVTLPPFPLGIMGKEPAGLDTLLSIALADFLETTHLQPSDDGQRWGVVVGSSRGYQAEFERLSCHWHCEAVLPSESNWAWLYGQSPAANIAQTLLTQRLIEPSQMRPVLAPRAACATGLWAIAQGVELIQSGQCDAVIAGAVEAPITPLTLAGFQRMGALAKDSAYPFDQRRHGFVLGEGAALLLLERRESALRRGARPYAQVLGFGLTNDAHHVNAPSQNSAAAIAAIQSCLDRSHLQPDQVDYIHAHGTATQLNDAAEASLIQALFPSAIAVSSTKGATGHTLGASGAIGAAFCVNALHHQQYPPCTGLQQPAYDLNLVLQTQNAPMQTALCLSFGFGGQNAAIAFAVP
jgi:3-oxoacyl-[acyl-carrier-protein] synthase II